MPEPPTQPHTPAGRTVDQSPEEIAALSASAAVPQVSGYEILGELGRGGMGVVYRARHLALDRPVAIKFLRPELARASAARRFREEARVTGQLAHPAIPPVHDFGELPDGRPFLVMKLIKGRTLADLLDENGRDRGALVAAFALVCQGVAYAHARGVIHRDLKPANLMVGAFGEVQVMDWGLAKVLGAPAHDSATEPADDATEIRTGRAGEVTHAGSVMGTPAYMSPEQAGGEVDKIDARSDVFGLGAILCAILTGGPPYAGPTTDSVRLQAVRGETSDALARLSACGADPELVALCARCLERDRAARPADAGELARALAEHFAAVETRARRAELDRARAEERAKGRRVQLALLAFAALVLAAGGALGWWLDRRSEQHRTEDERREAEAAARDARDREAFGFIEQLCIQSLRANDLAGARRALAQAEARLEGGRLDDLRPRVQRLKPELAFLAVVPDERRLAWATLEEVIFNTDATGKPLPKPAARPDPFALAFRELGITADMSASELRARVNGLVVRARAIEALADWQRRSKSGKLQQLADASGLWAVPKTGRAPGTSVDEWRARFAPPAPLIAPKPKGKDPFSAMDEYILGFVAPPPRAK
jgi:tRNA A-37 threonylcarbamoyl transferase component Bud32